MRRTGALLSMLVVAWVSGSVLGAAAPGREADAATVVVSQAHADYVPSLSGDEPVFVLVIGGDARPGADVTHSLADSIHLVSVDPATHRASILGIPRDSWVEIPGQGMNKVNAAMVAGGPPLLVETVEHMTGIRIGYYALTSFWGLTDIVDGLGGLTVKVPCKMEHPYSRVTFDPGRQRMDGEHVLAFARDRHSFPLGDLARSEDGGRVILGALAQFGREFAKDPSRLLVWMATGLRAVETDISIPRLLLLAFTASQVSPRHVQNLVLPTTPQVVESRDVQLVDASAQPIYSDLRTRGVVRRQHLPASPTQVGCET
jgi:polyisoprenyl-teichoic acid--peptidoglycan teichoic acid transferase